MDLIIRKAAPKDFDTIWPIFKAIVSAGETYAYDPKTTKEQGYHIWMEHPMATYLAEQDEQIVGTYFLRPNQPGLGAHICNCGYMVSSAARNQGIARALCLHSQEIARSKGFLAMQFNLVVSTNAAAIHLWQKLGFSIVGTVPRAFHHRQLGLVDTHVMYKSLTPEQ